MMWYDETAFCKEADDMLKDVLGWIRTSVMMLLKGMDGVPHENQKVFHIGPIFLDINSCGT